MQEIMGKLSTGDHVALFYRNQTEQFATAVPYIAAGLDRNERCLYIAEENNVRSVWEAMDGAGIDVDPAQETDALMVASRPNTFLQLAASGPGEMIDGLKKEIRFSLNQGFTAFSAIVEMAWMSELSSAPTLLQQCEAALEAQLPSRFGALYLYNEAAFPTEILSRALRTHRKIIAHGRLIENPCYVPGGELLRFSYPVVSLEDVLAGGMSGLVQAEEPAQSGAF